MELLLSLALLISKGIEHPEPKVASSAPLAPLTRPLTSFGAAVLDGEVYVLGGHGGRPHHYSRDDQSSAFLRLDLSGSGPWQTLGARARGVQSVALAAAGQSLYAVGGMEADNARGEPALLRSVASVSRFDKGPCAWTDLPALPEPRSSHAALIARGSLWVIGGWTLDSDGVDGGGAPCDSLLALDLSDPGRGWTSTPAPFERRGLAAAANSRWLAAIGGMDPEGHLSRAVDLFDFDSHAWTRGPDLPEEGFGAAAATLGETIYASTSSGTIWRLDLEHRAWVEAAQLAFPRRFHQLVACNAELIALGGTQGSQGVVHVERIRPGQAPQSRREVRVASPAAARNRQTMWVDGDALYMFGGNSASGQHDFAEANFCSEGWRLDLASLSWTRLADSPVRAQSSACVGLGQGRFWIAGGFGPQAGALQSLRLSAIYDVAADAWKTESPLEFSRTQFALLRHAERTLVAGGLDYDDSRAKDERFRYPLEVFERTAAGTLRAQETRLPRPRRAFGATVLAGRAYLIGGMAGEFEPVEACDSYDFERDSWSTLPAPRAPRISPELVALDSKLYLAGGSRAGKDDEPVADRSIEVYDPSTQTWSVLVEDIGCEPRQLRVFAHRERLLLVSTRNGPESGIELVWLDPAAIRAGSR